MNIGNAAMLAALIVVWLTPLVIAGLKGKPVLVALSVVGTAIGWGLIPAWVGAVRVAKPGSWWYRKRYVANGELEKIAIANARFEKDLAAQNARLRHELAAQSTT
jgi:hypothetical protein